MTHPHAAPDIREDPLTGRWIIIEPDRQRRPGARPRPETTYGDPADCPFCPGHEKETVAEVYAVRPRHSQPDTSGWRVRVFPNKYPILSGPMDRQTEEAYRHEVIVESPDHIRSISALSHARITEVMQVYRNRVSAAMNSGGAVTPVLFKNVGPLAGASQEHSHTQLLWLPRMPRDLEDEMTAVQQYSERHRVCWYCRMLESETADDRRVVAGNADGCVVTPEYSRFPYEMILLPRRHEPFFNQAGDSVLEAVGTLLHTAVNALECVTGACDYNFYLRTAPGKPEEWSFYHWHIVITPRLAGIAAFELGTGVYVNTVAPEDAATALREAVSSFKWK